MHFDDFTKLVEERLKSLGMDYLRAFKIGKTADFNRREAEYMMKNEGDSYNELPFTHVCQILKGNPTLINGSEKRLIDYFTHSSVLKDKCLNKISGGGGNENADTLYIALKCKVKTIDELDGDILDLKDYEISEDNKN